MVLLHFRPLPIGFVKKDRRGTAHIQRIYCRRHWNRDRIIAQLQHGPGNAMTLTAKNDATIFGEIRVRQRSLLNVWMRRDAANPALFQARQAFQQIRRLDNR